MQDRRIRGRGKRGVANGWGCGWGDGGSGGFSRWRRRRTI